MRSAVCVLVAALLVAVAHAQLAPSPPSPPPPRPPPSPAPPPPPPPPKECDGEDRGWLSRGSAIGEHPRGLYGPSGLHGVHYLLQTSSPDLVIDVRRSRSVTTYYPGNEYTVNIRCSTTCAFLITVEEGPLSNSSCEAQVGDWVNVEDSEKTRRVTGRCDYKAVTNTNYLARDYSMTWRAPMELTYQPLFVRVTWVLDNQFFCPGKFSQVELTSEVQCGDKFLDTAEKCDDGNQQDGDGCSSRCQIEPGWTCDTIYNGTMVYTDCFQCTVLLHAPPPEGSTRGHVSTMRVTEGTIGNYEVSLSRPVQIGTSVSVYIFLGGFARDLTVLTPLGFSFNFTYEGETAWNVRQLVGFQVAGNEYVDYMREANITHTVISQDTNYRHNYATVGGVMPVVPLSIMRVLIIDDDVLGLLPSKYNLTVAEGGLTDMYTLRLTSEPQGLVFIKISSDPPDQVFTDQRLVFGSANWMIEQTVTVLANDNRKIDGDLMVTILHTIDVNATSDEYYKQLDLSSANVNCLTYDNDAPGLIASPRSVAVTENTGPGYYTLSLATEPTAPTLVNLTADPGLTAILDQTGEPWVWFTPEDWDADKPIKLIADDNQIADGQRQLRVHHLVTSTDPNYASLNNATSAPWEVLATVTDDDIPAVVYETTATVTEGAGATQLVVTLQTIPRQPVRVYLSFADSSYLTLGGVLSDGDQRFLEWESADWDTPKTLLLQTFADNFFADVTDSGTRVTTLHLTTYSEDAAYNEMNLRPVTVTTVDNDQAAFVWDPSSDIEVTEGIWTPLYLNLASQPQLRPDRSSHTVQVLLYPDVQLDVEPRSVLFDASNYSERFPIMLRGRDDTVLEPMEHGSVLTFGLRSTDPEYAKVTLPDFRVTVKENDRKVISKVVSRWGDSISPFTPYGAVVVTIPVKAVEEGTTVTVEEMEPRPLPNTAAPPKPGTQGFRVSGTYSFLPHGVDFLQPVQINCEYDIRAAVESGGELMFYRSETSMEGPWEPVQGGKFQEGIASVLVDSFSLYYVGASGLAPPPPEQLSPPPIDPCFGLVPPEDDVVTLTEYVLIAVLAVENLLGIGGIIMYVSWRSRQRPKIIHVDDNLEPMFTLPGMERELGYGDHMTLPGPYGGELGGELAPGLPLEDELASEVKPPPPNLPADAA